MKKIIKNIVQSAKGKLFKAKLLTVYCILLTAVVNAQTFPVQVNPQLVPPYSLKLSDYETTTSEKLFVNILLTDINEQQRQVGIKMYIEGQGLNIQTVNFITGAAPIFLDGGINLRLTNLDLQPFFNINNLQGITPQQYNLPLPDGRYDFCFEVFDFLSGQRISRKSCTSVFLLLNDPPILNTPYRGDVVTAKNPQNIIFNWTPRHLNATAVQYEFTLKEIWDTQINPQAAFEASVPLHQVTTSAATLLLGPGDPPLLEGKNYAWQVRALVSDGISETSVFRNSGYSEIFYFSYQANCDPPSYVISEALNSENVKVLWQSGNHLRYEIQYRKKGYGDNDWFNLYSYNQDATIRNLEAGTTYEFRVGGECVQDAGFSFSEIKEFTTPTEDEEAYYNCGVLPEVDIANQDPLQNIGVNEVFTAGDFPVTVKEISGNNGVFSGWGFIVVPYLADTKIRVEFSGIGINTNYQLTSGVVETTYDANWEGIANINEVVDAILGDNGDINQFNAENVNIVSVVVTNGNVTLVDQDGNEIPIETELPVIITDSEGEQWRVNEDGTVDNLGPVADGGVPNAGNTNGVSNNGTVNQITSTDVSIVFSTSGFYSTDLLPQNVTDKSITKEYQTLPKADNTTYNVLYKAVSNAPKETDSITATATFTNGKTKEDIVFKTKQGTAVPFAWSGNTATLTLKKQFPFAKDQILATVKQADSTANQDVAGTLNLWHLEQKNINVTVVPLNNATIARGFTNNLNAIYNKAGIKFTVTQAPPLNIPQSVWDKENNNNKLDIGDSNVLANYTIEERAIYNYYKQERDVSAQMYYIFLTGDITTTRPEINGFMPLKRQYGFVFNQPNAQDQIRTAAHELGHGVFGLKHYEDAYADDFLMHKSSATGTLLTHMDWQKLHAPGLQLYLFQSDEDGESTQISGLPDGFENSDGTYTFMTLNGSYITLPKKTKKIVFTTGLDRFNDFIDYPVGALIAFTLDNIKYKVDIVRNQSVVNTTFTQNDLNFNYNGFISLSDGMKYENTGRDAYYGKVISFIPYSQSKKLLSHNIQTLNFSEESNNINLLTNYNNYQKFYSADNIENDKDFSYSSTSVFNEQYIMQYEYMNEVLSGFSWEDKHPILVKYAILNNSQNEVFEAFFEEKYQTEDYLTLFQNKSIEELKTIYIDLINYFKITQADLIEQFKNHIDNSNISSASGGHDFSFESLFKVCAKLSSEQIKNDISFDYRTRGLIKLLIGEATKGSDYTNFWDEYSADRYEDEMLRLLKFSPDNEIDNLLTFIEINTLNSASNNHVWFNLFNGINDAGIKFWTKDNRKELIQILTNKYLKSLRFTQDLNSLIQAKEELDTEYINNRTIISNYRDIFQRTWVHIKGTSFLTANDLYYKFDTDYNKDNGKINVEKNLTLGFIVGNKKKFQLSPFELILFKSNSNLKLLSNYNTNGKKELAPVPAIVLYYDDTVRDNDTYTDIAQSSFDLATLVIPGAQFTQLGKIGKVVYIADKASSVLSIAGNATENVDSQVSNVLNAASVVLGVLDFSNSAGVALKKKIRQNQINKTLTESFNDYNTLINTINNHSIEALSKLTANQKKQVKAILKIEADALTIEGKIIDGTKFFNALNKIDGIVEEIVDGVRKYADFISPLEKLRNNSAMAEEAWLKFVNKKHDDLYAYFKANNINFDSSIADVWPPANGFSKINGTRLGTSIVENTSATKPNKFDRFQTQSSLGGSFASPVKNNEGVGDLYYTYDSRALANNLEEGMYHFEFQLSNNVRSDLTFTEGDVMPWFNRETTLVGEQIKSNIPFHSMNANEFKNIIVQKRVNGQWSKCVVEGKEVLNDLQVKINANLSGAKADKLVDDLNSSVDLRVLFKNSTDKEALIKAWEEALNKGIDELIRKKTNFLESLSKFPFGTSKKEIINNATDSDFIQLLSGKLKNVPDPHPSISTMLKNKFGTNTKTSVKFDTDPSAKEFDAVTDALLVEHKYLTSINPMSTAKRIQMKFQMRSCKALNKDNFLMFEGVQNDDWINKAIQYANQYQVNTKIELNGIIIHDIIF